MTNRDVIIKMIMEVTNRSESEAEELFDIIKTKHPFPPKRLNQEISDEEADRLIRQFRTEPSGILAWVVRGLLCQEQP